MVNVDLQRKTEEFTYTTGVVAIAGVVGQTAQATVNIGADSGFIQTKRTVVVLDAADAFLTFAAGVAIPESNHPADRISVDMRLSNPARSVIDPANPIPLSSFAGTSRLPYILPSPLVSWPNSQLFLTFTNLVATAVRVRVSFHGIKVYDLNLLAQSILAV